MHSTSAQSKSKWATFSSNHSENLKAPPGRMSSADGAKGLCPLDSRNFFEKKLTKSFPPPAGGDESSGCIDIRIYSAARPAGRDGGPGGILQNLILMMEVLYHAYTGRETDRRL